MPATAGRNYEPSPLSVELRPLAVSLNSFNGFMTLTDGTRLFYKTHTEPDSVIDEYYNTTTLADAGYPVIKPLYSSTEWGKQLLIYEVIEDSSVFDVAWAIEIGESDQLPQLTGVRLCSNLRKAPVKPVCISCSIIGLPADDWNASMDHCPAKMAHTQPLRCLMANIQCRLSARRTG